MYCHSCCATRCLSPFYVSLLVKAILWCGSSHMLCVSVDNYYLTLWLEKRWWDFSASILVYSFHFNDVSSEKSLFLKVMRMEEVLLWQYYSIFKTSFKLYAKNIATDNSIRCFFNFVESTELETT